MKLPTSKELSRAVDAAATSENRASRRVRRWIAVIALAQVFTIAQRRGVIPGYVVKGGSCPPGVVYERAPGGVRSTARSCRSSIRCSARRTEPAIIALSSIPPARYRSASDSESAVTEAFGIDEVFPKQRNCAIPSTDRTHRNNVRKLIRNEAARSHASGSTGPEPPPPNASASCASSCRNDKPVKREMRAAMPNFAVVATVSSSIRGRSMQRSESERARPRPRASATRQASPVCTPEMAFPS